uniref:Cadherin domain-containing protein n=1 Tax=Clastoptera arizonana TaxID=38151 RepID=A0A1B6CRZ6_9HEMI
MNIKVFVLWLGFVFRVYGDNIGDCGLVYNGHVLSLDEWKFGFFLQGKIPDNVEVGKTVATFQTVNISGVSKFESQFFHPNFNSSTSVLTLSLSEALDESKYSIRSEMPLKIYFNCFRDTANIYMYMEVEDVNDHKPEFSTQTYIYNLPMPFPRGIDITSAFGDVFVTDDDFTNTKVDFSIDSIGKKYFNVSSGKTDGKKYFMILKSKSRIDLHQNISFSITATDNGFPPLQSNALVTITANSEYSIPSSPIFLSPIYISSVDEINLSKTIPLKIVLDEGYGTNLTLQLKDIQSANWSKYFTADINGSSFINIHLIEQLPADLLNFTNAIIIVEVTSLGAAHTGQSVLLITGPCSPSSTDYPPTESPTTAPCPGIPLHFDKVSYTVLAKKNQFGMLTQFTAVSDHQDEIEFGISSDSELVKKFLRIGPKDGFLYADEPLTNNTEYYFNVTAKIISTKELASAKVELSVFSTASIETPRFNKSLEYHYITEENIGETIEPEIIYPSISVLPCNFEIKTQNPLGSKKL